MLNIISNEVYKIVVRKKIYIFLGILFVMAVVTGITTLHANKLFGTEGGPQEGLIAFARDNGQNFPLILLNGVSSFIMPIIAVILLADMITDEYGEGTLKLTLLRQVSRGKLLIGKLIALSVVLEGLFLFTLIIGYIIGTILLGWGNEFVIKEIVLTSAMGIFLTLAVYALSIVVLIAFATIILIFGVLLSNGGEVIGIGVGILFIAVLLGQISGRISPFLMTNFLNLPRLIYADMGMESILGGVLISALYGAVAFVISLNIFKKKDMLL